MLHYDIWLLRTFLQPQSFIIILISTDQIKSDSERVKEYPSIYNSRFAGINVLSRKTCT